MASTAHRCPKCGNTFVHDYTNCPYCGAPLAPEAAPAALSRSCSVCKGPLAKAGDLSFRVGGAVGGAGMLLGGWNQLNESLQPFSVYLCAACRRFEFFEPGA